MEEQTPPPVRPRWPEHDDVAGTAEPKDARGLRTSPAGTQIGTGFWMRTARQSHAERASGGKGLTVECAASNLVSGFGAAMGTTRWWFLRISFSEYSRLMS
ncbi:unnamed protein product [Urochloa humidicola]